MPIGSRPRQSLRNLLIRSPKPCHVNMSTRIYDMKFVMVGSALEDCTLASGWGNCCVGDHGILAGLAMFAPMAKDLREHHMKRNAELLCNVQMTEARWIRNYSISDERLL